LLGHDIFLPLMTVYLNETSNKNDIKKSYKNKSIFGAKLYPAGATTNSESGVKNIEKIIPVLETMSEIGMPLLIHGEVTDPNIDIFDREKVFIDTVLDRICREVPNLKITLEHITTNDAVQYIKDGKSNIAASITPHHLALNRNAIFAGGIRPHYYCLPVLKREKHRLALLEAAISGNKKFFLGTDSAPHTIINKESSCGCAGIFNSTYCISILTQIFSNHNALNKLENFTSINGSVHYSLPINKTKIKIKKREIPIDFIKNICFEKEKIIIFNPRFPIFWEVIGWIKKNFW